MSRREAVADELRAVAMGADVGPITMCSLLTNAADMLDPPKDESMIEVRVLVRVVLFDDDSLSYESAGTGSGKNHRHPSAVAQDLDDYCERTRDTWITARVPKPAPVGEVEGTVEP